MNNQRDIVKLSDAISKLLSTENRHKSLGELNQELSDYVIEIKELSETNSISFDRLKEEISKHIDLSQNNIPGSISQLLIGCIGDNICPISKKEEADDIPFVYDYKKSTLKSLSKNNIPITEDSYAVVYINGKMGDLDLDALKDLLGKGFNKMKIMYKETGKSDYKTVNIENLKKYIYFKPDEKKLKNSMTFFVLIVALVLLLYTISLVKNK